MSKSDDLPPSYTATAPSFAPLHRGQQLLDRVTLTRTHHIRSTIETSILPNLESQAAHGIARTTLALIPSDVQLPAVPEKSEFSFENDDAAPPVEVIGFAPGDEPKVVRLEGNMDRTEFWRAEGVVGELEKALRDMLCTTAQFGGMGSVASSSLIAPVEREMKPKQQRKRFLGKAIGKKEERVASEEALGTGQLPGTGSVLVAVRLEWLSLRTLSEFGLWDTMARQCIIVQVDARG